MSPYRAPRVKTASILPIVCLLGAGCGGARPRTAEVLPPACEALEGAVRAFSETLITSDVAPPRADPVRSPAAADRLVDGAEACLKARGIRYGRAGRRITVAPERASLGATAAEVARATGGVTVYDGDFFLERPYAAASFDWEKNVLYLPHAAVMGGAPSLALAHELFHVTSDGVRRRDGARVRHIVIRHPGTEPNALEVDEVFAYAQASRSSAGDEAARRRSSTFSSQYLNFAREALARDDAKYALRGAPACAALAPAARSRIEEVLRCTERCAADPACDVLACDLTPVGTLCAAP